MAVHELTSVPGTGRRLLFAAATWLAVAVTARAVLDSVPADSSWRVPVALLPLPAFGWFLRVVVQGVRGLDELGRRIHLEALAIAFPLATVLLMVLGLLQLAVTLPAADFSYRHVWYWLPICYFIGLAFASRRYA